jgi:hypothetical protein
VSPRGGGREGRSEPPVPAADEQAAASSPRSRAASAYTVTVEATPAPERGAVLAPPTFPPPSGPLPAPAPSLAPPPPRAGPRPAPSSARGRRWAPGLARSPGRTHTSTHARPPRAALSVAGPRSSRPCRRTERRKMADDSMGHRGCSPAAAAAAAAAAGATEVAAAVRAAAAAAALVAAAAAAAAAGAGAAAAASPRLPELPFPLTATDVLRR